MAKIDIDPGQAISYGKQIITNAETYNAEIKKIYNIVDDLKATWTGSAAQRFTDKIGNYRKDYEEFGKLIKQFGELLEAIGKDYQSLEDEL